MQLYAIAIYRPNGVNKPYLHKVATPKNQSFFTLNKPLDTFERSTLLKVCNGIDANAIYHASVGKEHHYVQHAANDHIRVIISATELTEEEQGYLFFNSKHVALDKILQNPSDYAYKDCSPSRAKMDEIQKKLEQTRYILLEDIKLVAERGEKLSVLENRAEDLQYESLKFGEEAKKLNPCCSYW